MMLLNRSNVGLLLLLYVYVCMGISLYKLRNMTQPPIFVFITYII